MEENGSYRGSGDKKTIKDLKKIGRLAVIIAVIVVLAVGVLTCAYTVDDKQQGVVTTFG